MLTWKYILNWRHINITNWLIGNMLLSNNGYSLCVSLSISLFLSLSVSISLFLSRSSVSLLLLLLYGPVVFAINVGQCQSVKLSLFLSLATSWSPRENCYRKLVRNSACSKTNRNHWCQNNADIHQRDCHRSLSVTPVIMSTFLRAHWTGSLSGTVCFLSRRQFLNESNMAHVLEPPNHTSTESVRETPH